MTKSNSSAACVWFSGHTVLCILYWNGMVLYRTYTTAVYYYR